MLFWHVSLMTVLWVVAANITGVYPLLAGVAATMAYRVQTRVLAMETLGYLPARTFRALSLLAYTFLFTIIVSNTTCFFFATALYAFLIDDLLVFSWRKDRIL